MLSISTESWSILNWLLSLLHIQPSFTVAMIISAAFTILLAITTPVMVFADFAPPIIMAGENPGM